MLNKIYRCTSLMQPMIISTQFPQSFLYFQKIIFNQMEF